MLMTFGIACIVAAALLSIWCGWQWSVVQREEADERREADLQRSRGE